MYGPRNLCEPAEASKQLFPAVVDQTTKKTESTALDEREDQREDPAVTERLKKLRSITTGGNQAAFARWLGIPINRWYHYENGYPLTRQMALLLRSKFGHGLSFDWLYFGDPGNLSNLMTMRLDLKPYERRSAAGPNGGSRSSDDSMTEDAGEA
jgi:hypothetical protein